MANILSTNKNINMDEEKKSEDTVVTKEEPKKCWQSEEPEVKKDSCCQEGDSACGCGSGS